MTKHCARLALLLLMLGVGFPLAGRAAADALAPWSGVLLHTAWTREDGAPSAVFSLAQDGQGLLWFAASDGLYTFDGVRFQRHDSVYGHPLQSPITVSVAAHGDTIWVAYQFGGISRFDRDGVRHYLPGQDAPERSAHGLQRTPDGTMWATTSEGLQRLDGERWRAVLPHEGLPPHLDTELTVMPDGSLVVLAAGGLYRSVASGVAGQFRFRPLVPDRGVFGCDLLPDGRLMIRTRAHGMQVLDPDSGRRRAFSPHIGNDPILGFRTDRRGGVWIGNDDSVRLLDREGRVLRRLDAATGLSGRTYTGMLSDREGNVWFSTPNGIDRVRQARLTTIALPPGFSGGLSVTAGADGAVWVNEMFSQSSLDRNRARTPTFRLMPDGRRLVSTITSVSSSHRQADGTLWFGSDLRLWQVKDGVTRSWPLPPTDARSNVQAMTTDRDGTLWVSLIRRGIHTFRDGVWRPAGGDPELARQTAIVLASDRGGRIWFGYPGNRVAVYDGRTVRRFGPEHGLALGNTLSIVAGRDRIWFGGDLGLAWFDGARFHTLHERARRGFRGVSGIVERANGELWLHDTGGLARIGAADLPGPGTAAGAQAGAERFDYLDGHHGMAAQIQPIPSLLASGQGRLWYATSGGVGYIDPDAIARNPRAPTVLVTAIRSDRRHYLPGAGLVLPAGTTRLEIDYTATALSIPERVRFRYRLAGQDALWRDAGAARQAVYTNLAPGSYTFEVHAANEDGVWTAQPARAAFRIEPAFLQTVWFKLACASALLAAAWLLHRWRLRRLEARLHEHLKVRLLERERIARTLHDTFLQSVQALVLGMHGLLGKLPQDSGVPGEVGEVLARAEDVIEEGRQRVRQLRLPGVRHGCLHEALGDAGRELAETTGIGFALELTGSARELDPDIEDEVLTIGREALSNAFHHARASRVALALDYRPDSLLLAVSDDGAGIAPEILERGARPGHWGLPGMRERARLAGGALAIDSAPGGTTISVCIPLDPAHQSMQHA